MNYYEILGVKSSVTDKELKKAYRVLAKKYHPDAYQGDKEFAENKMKLFNEAYDTLSNAQLRAAYDEKIGINQYTKTSSYSDYTAQESEINTQRVKPESNTRKVKYTSAYYKPNYEKIYYDQNGYARANYTPYSEEEDETAYKAYNINAVNGKKLAYLIGLLVGGLIAVIFVINQFVNIVNDIEKEFNLTSKNNANMNESSETYLYPNENREVKENVYDSGIGKYAESNIEISEEELKEFLEAINKAGEDTEKLIRKFIDEQKLTED